MKLRLCLVALVAATAFLPLPAAEKSTPAPDPATLPAPQRTVVPRLEGTVTIDGELDEAVWAGAARLGPFRRNDGAGPEREPTLLRIWYNDTGIFLGWTCTDADIQATMTARDANLWEEEVVEFFVAPSELRRYHELQWNPVGGIFDGIVTNDLDERGLSRKISVDRSFTVRGMQSAVRMRRPTTGAAADEGRWQVEVRIPFSDFDRPAPRRGDVWRANFYRYNRTRGQREELVSWSPTLLRSFHQPSRFGYLEFGR